MNKSGLNIYLLLFSFMFFGQVEAQTAFEELRSKFEENGVFYAEFKHTYVDSYTEESTVSNGEVWIGKNGYKLRGNDQIIVVDGELSRVYDEQRNRLIISEYEEEEDDFAPSRFLSGLDEMYSASEAKNEDGKWVITLTTEDDFAVFLEVVIELNEINEPVKITAYDIADNIIITEFENGLFSKATEDVFQLEYPEDTEIVDMRH